MSTHDDTDPDETGSDATEHEQLAEDPDDYDDLDPRGEYRDTTSGFLFSRQGDSPRITRDRRPSGSWIESEVDIAPAPRHIDYDFREYFLEFSFVQSALQIFSETVVEPGWEVEATLPDATPDDDEPDEPDDDMTEALRLWGEHCAIHAGEPGHDLIHVLRQCPSLRRAKPAVFVEKVGTRDEPDALAAVQLLDPSTMTIRLRHNQNLVVHPDDPVPPAHPRTDAGEAAAYVQYDDDASSVESWDEDEIPFAVDDLIKLVYDPPEGSPWGRTIWPALKDPIKGLKQKLRDRNAAIRLAGHPHRIYSSDSWTESEAKSFAEAHETGEVSVWEDQEETGYAARIDYVPHTVNVQVEEGNVADIQDAIMDDIEAIFAMMPVSKFKIAYEEGINQFVVEPQQEKDDLWIDKERRYLESVFGDMFRAKADELDGGEYGGEVDFRIRQPEADNPLERADFDADTFKTFINAFTDYASSNAVADFPRELIFEMAGMDPEEFELEELDEVDEMDPAVQDAANAMGFPGAEQPAPGEPGGPPLPPGAETTDDDEEDEEDDE